MVDIVAMATALDSSASGPRIGGNPRDEQVYHKYANFEIHNELVN